MCNRILYKESEGSVKMILKGYELLKEIADGNIKEGTKFIDITEKNYADYSNVYRYKNKNFIGRWGGTNLLMLLNHDFEIIEESEQDIDIQNIEELLPIEDYEFDKTDGRLNRDKINELIRAVKQLDNKAKEK